nr:MAG: hypothetical protein TU36_08850 [Vulcanisaeta sp. AZ3]
MSVVSELVNKVFSNLNENVIIKVKDRNNPLVSEYIIKVEKCPDLNLNNDITLDRESTWYIVLTTGIGIKLSINRVIIEMKLGDGFLTVSLDMMNGDRLKSSEEFVLSCGGRERSVYGKSILDLLINLDLYQRFLNMVKEREKEKLSDELINELTKPLVDVKSKVEGDLRRLVSVYQWFEE